MSKSYKYCLYLSEDFNGVGILIYCVNLLSVILLK